MDDRKRIAEQVLAARKRKAWTQEQLAEAAGVSQSLVAKIENGLTVRNSYLKKVASALGAAVNTNLVLVFEIEEPPPVKAAVIAAQDLPMEHDELAARVLRSLPHLPPRALDALLADVVHWEEDLIAGQGDVPVQRDI